MAQFAQKNLDLSHKAVIAQGHDFVDIAKLRRNGPGSSNYTNCAGTTAANEFSAGSAVLFANYLDPYRDVAAGLTKALYMCAPVLFDNGRGLGFGAAVGLRNGRDRPDACRVAIHPAGSSQRRVAV